METPSTTLDEPPLTEQNTENTVKVPITAFEGFKNINDGGISVERKDGLSKREEEQAMQNELFKLRAIELKAKGDIDAMTFELLEKLRNISVMTDPKKKKSEIQILFPELHPEIRGRMNSETARIEIGKHLKSLEAISEKLPEMNGSVSPAFKKLLEDRFRQISECINNRMLG